MHFLRMRVELSPIEDFTDAPEPEEDVMRGAKFYPGMIFEILREIHLNHLKSLQIHVTQSQFFRKRIPGA